VALNFTAGQSPVTYDDIYIGEAYDATLEQLGWTDVNFVPPAGALPWLPANVTSGGAAGQAALSLWTLPVTIDETFPAVSVTEPVPSQFVIDFGQNMAGFVTMQVPQFAVPGTVIYLSHAEILHEDGTINDVYRNAPMQANYTVGSTSPGGSYTVQFSYMGFRYVQVSGFPGVPTREDFVAHFVHSANRRTAQFSSDNAELNAVTEITRYAAMSNQMDIPTDCPQRERRGWMGDAQLSCEVVLTTQEAGAFYTKFVRDIADSQAFLSPTGAVPDCVPWYHHGGLPADPAWGIAAALIPQWASDYLDDVRIVQRQYESTKAYTDSELARSPGNILDSSRYGDWCAVYDSLSEGCAHKSSAVSTFYLISALDTVADFATQLGKTADAANYTQLAATTRKAFVAQFYHESNNSFADGNEMDLILPLATPNIGLTQAQLDGLAQSLVQRITTESAFPNHPTGGIVYTKLLWPVLDAIGRSDLGLTMMLAGPAKPGFDEMINQTATTLWESWNMDQFEGSASRNHIMFGGASGLWPYTTVAGLRRQGRGWSQMRMEPAVSAAAAVMTTASGSIDSPVGLFESSWTTSESSSGSCVASVPESSVASFICLGPDGKTSPTNVFTGVAFASFGTSTGSCAGGFVKSTCDANTSVPILTSACVGKSQCSVNISDATFGDPCFQVVKHFSAKLVGTCEQVVLQQTASFPANTAGTVLVAVASPATAVISESGTQVWVAGAFVPGVAGITGAKAVATGVEFTVGSGQFQFQALGTGI
jgi:alpha-L-rhamnosidase